MATTMKCGWRVERRSVIVDVNIQEGKREVGSFEALLNPKLLVIVSSGHVAATHKRDDANE